jgi:hypothetical protein
MAFHDGDILVFDKNEQFALFENLGEKEVRERIAARIWNEERVSLANEWLRQQDQAKSDEEARKIATSREEELSIARDAKDAAWAAARAAERAADAAEAANKKATMAQIIAAISAIIAAAAMVISLLSYLHPISSAH